jgi:hypothetical protein
VRIFPSRGLQQEDPISPYLFLICAKVLNSLLTSAERNGQIRGVPTSKKGPYLNHLFFVDDSLLFCKADLRHWHRMELLGTYEKTSGQWLNKERLLYFLVKTPPPKLRLFY